MHYVRLGVVSPVGTDGRPPTHNNIVGWSENRERERECFVHIVVLADHQRKLCILRTVHSVWVH